MPNEGIPARLTRYFLKSKLTPALIVAMALWGLFAIANTPRQENPQITMPAATVVTQYPGASSQEVQRLITDRGERVLQEIPGIDHVYSVSTQDASVVTVLFKVGADPTSSFVNLYDQIFSHLNELPPRASQPQITPLSVDDIPIIVLTLHGQRYDRAQLYAAAERLVEAIRPLEGVSTIDTYGGRPHEVNVTLDPVRLAAYGLSPPQIEKAIVGTNITQAVGALRNEGAGSELVLHAGTPFTSAPSVAAQIVSVSDGHPVTLGDVATVTMGATPDESRTTFGWGGSHAGASEISEPAVSIAIAKKMGTNSVAVADAVLGVVRGTHLPPGVTASVTRDDGKKANDAVNELIQRLIEAIVIVVVLLLLALGIREAMVVATAIPLTLFVTLGVGMLFHQSINRITLFALILALGLLVDDAIVVVENIHRHYHAEPGTNRAELTVRAVREIGSPTVLATLTVVLSFLPMLFVTGMMGPYMRPIPINVPVAMAASLFIAFAITPWATYRALRNRSLKAEGGTPVWVRPFRSALTLLLDNPRAKRSFLWAIAAALAVSIALPGFELMKFRMLPRANETSFVVSIDAPPSSTIATTEKIAGVVAATLAKTPEVENYQTFAGTHSIPKLESLLLGTVFRNAPNLADINVNLVPKGARKIQSATLVRDLRRQLQAAVAPFGATLRILQTPPGPPVRDTVLAKIYGPDPEVRRAIASRLTGMMQREPGVVDVDSSFKSLPASLNLEIDQDKAAIAGVNADEIAQTLAMSLRGAIVSSIHTASDPRPVGVFLRFAPEFRADPSALGSIQISTKNGTLVPLSAVTHLAVDQAQQPLYRDDYSNVSYVAAEMAGRSSTYAVIDMLVELWHNPLPRGYVVAWGGEWHLTNTVFADLGRAMLLSFILIYFVLVARFRSFTKPLVVLAAVPLAMIGVFPGFAFLAPFGIYFSATAMIGLIALIGIVVRNSIILIEFIEDRLNGGAVLRDALIETATARTRPIFLTAAAGVLSSIVIAADPVWSGLAWTLVFGMTTSAVLSVLAIPVLYGLVADRKRTSASSERRHAKPPWSTPENA